MLFWKRSFHPGAPEASSVLVYWWRKKTEFIIVTTRQHDNALRDKCIFFADFL